MFCYTVSVLNCGSPEEAKHQNKHLKGIIKGSRVVLVSRYLKLPRVAMLDHPQETTKVFCDLKKAEDFIKSL